MAHKIDRDMLDLSTYVNEKEDNLAWWFDWCKDEDPLTFWDRRLTRRRAYRNSGNRFQAKQREQFS